MQKLISLIHAAALGGAIFTTAARAQETGFKSLFNGKDLTGWRGNPALWSVQDGAITGKTGSDPETKINHNTFLVYTNGPVDDFELRLSYRITPNNGAGFANSGIQYRSKVVEEGKFGPIVGGYQADFEAGKVFSGILYEERGRGILAQRGQKTVIKDQDGKTKVEVTGSIGDSKEIQSKIKDEDWNDYVVIAKGNHFQHFINGRQTVDVVDEQTSKAAKSGVLALQIHVGAPMTVQFKNIRMKKFSGDTAQRSDLEQMQGNWVPVEIVANGKSASAETLAGIKVKIRDHGYVSDRADRHDEGTFKLNEGATPRSMDLTTGSGDEVRAIYEISDDTFKACYAIRDASRPTEFKSEEDSNHVLVVYKRKKD
jgi:uncharacterized protein (TIGR03067 family)